MTNGEKRGTTILLTIIASTIIIFWLLNPVKSPLSRNKTDLQSIIDSPGNDPTLTDSNYAAPIAGKLTQHPDTASVPDSISTTFKRKRKRRNATTTKSLTTGRSAQRRTQQNIPDGKSPLDRPIDHNQN